TKSEVTEVTTTARSFQKFHVIPLHWRAVFKGFRVNGGGNGSHLRDCYVVRKFLARLSRFESVPTSSLTQRRICLKAARNSSFKVFPAPEWEPVYLHYSSCAFLQLRPHSWRVQNAGHVTNSGFVTAQMKSFLRSPSEMDSEWVEEFLVQELEGSQPPFRLCLHKRDFLPGQWIVDNIIDAMEKSHTTLFVLSQHFVNSEWCKYELEFSHFRLFDENNDTAVLILLEPIAKETIPKRFCKLRKFMNSRTYLEWPEDEEQRPLFWHNLKDAINRDDY
ncbi:hypothetical protein GJAV_G00166460, partial [Gymnothorax javanicus]